MLTPAEETELLDLLEAEERHRATNKLSTYYPDEGPLRRDLYPKHVKFFAAGLHHRERLMLAANRVGKTEGIGGYETAVHLTGLYPAWWPGRRWDRPISAWVAGKTNESTRDIVQAKLLGRVVPEGGRKGFSGTGLIPKSAIGAVTWKSGVQDLADTVAVRHASGGWSVMGFKTYAQGRGAFEGTEQDLVWVDEEPPLDVYTEALIRTATTGGSVMLTFTPLEGMSEVVMAFLDGGKLPGGDAE